MNNIFYTSLIGAFLSAIVLLGHTVFLKKPLLEIDTEVVKTNLPNQKNLELEWVRVSRIAMGVSNITFFVDGGNKQQRLDLSSLKYGDIAAVKTKVIELSEFKNIPYGND